MVVLNPENRDIICFIHRGRSLFLECATAQAYASGYVPIVIGDEAARCKSGAQHFDIAEYFGSASAFGHIYNHISANPYDYELFCFQRWFVALDFLKSLDRPMWFADHDILLYPGIEQYSKLMLSIVNGPVTMNSAWLNYFSSRQQLEDMCNYLILTQQDVSLNSPSDMNAMISYADTISTPVLNSAFYGSSLGLDENFRLDSGYQTRNGHKFVRWDNDIPYCTTKNGELKRFYSFHFQGPSKVLMERMHKVKNPAQLLHLSTMSDSVNMLGNDELGQLVLNEYNALSAATPI